MRECGDCKECCIVPYGEAYGHPFGNGTPCKFLGECGCKIYKVRPEFCRKYYCAWAQELLPEEMRPDKCKVLVSVENGEDGQFLRVVNSGKEKINSDILNYFKMWGERMNAPVIYRENNSWRHL